MCQERGETWNLGNFICAFSVDNFANNWNCATIDAIRQLAINIENYNNQKYTTINISEVTLDDKPIGLLLYFSWYKQSGTVDSMYILDRKRFPRIPTEEELLEIIKYFEIKKLST
jgi:hypothetical protein